MAETTTETAMTPEIEAVVKFWSGFLGGPVRHDNGDGLQSAMAAAFLQPKTGLTEAQITAFEKALAHRIEADPYSGRCIDVDYGPDRILVQACADAGFDAGNRFPWKTLTSMSPGNVQCREGYSSGAPWRVLYKAA